MKTRIFILTVATLTYSIAFAGDPIYVKQLDGTVQKIDTLDTIAVQARIDALNSRVQALNIDNDNKNRLINENNIEIGNAQREIIALIAVR